MGTHRLCPSRRQISMKFVAVLLLVVPFVAGGGQGDMMQMMQQQMMQMMQQKGWGGEMQQQNNNNNGNDNGQWWDAQKPEDYEAYMKWCEERKMAVQEQQQQQDMLKQFQMAEEKREMEHKQAAVHKEIEEKRESMMAQWKMWQNRLSQQHEFDNKMDKFAEMKHHYMFAVTMEFLKFCKCSDFTEELHRYFMHGDMKYDGGDDWDLDDLEGIDTTNAVAVAQQLANRPASDQVKAFFGGMATTMCMAGRAYVEQVKAWEGQYKFLDRLM